ncbi:uncharacterized protein TrAtP1_004796 [Trichoderma atroviride]|uniref:uncharacterized protein n=1 Tax=Hypocrea atroviridis TaxID=63577 RepID=UPI003325ABDB|nr:hypothetical protein TrAtP1_004796 [Trichoderma atroviride]
MAAPAQPGQGRLRPLEPRPRPPVSHYADRPLSQGQALSARPDRPRRTRPAHCAWILHALRFAGAGTYRPRWPALARKASPAKFSSLPPKARRRPSRGTAGQKPIGLCHPGPNEEPTHDTARLQPPEIISSSHLQYLYMLLHTAFSIRTYSKRHGPGSFESWS